MAQKHQMKRFTQALQAMKDYLDDGLLKKIDNTLFIGMLNILREVLSQLSILGKNFQTGSLNFTRVVSSTDKIIRNMKSLVSRNTPCNKLLADVEGRLLLSDNQLTENLKKLFTV